MLLFLSFSFFVFLFLILLSLFFLFLFLFYFFFFFLFFLFLFFFLFFFFLLLLLLLLFLFLCFYRLAGLVVKACASRVADTGFDSRLRRGHFSGSSHTSSSLQWLPCQVLGVLGSALELVGSVSIYCDWA